MEKDCRTNVQRGYITSRLTASRLTGLDMKAKILIVDDDPDIATMLEDRLQASDYGTVIAHDGVAGARAGRAGGSAPHVARSGYATPDRP